MKKFLEDVGGRKFFLAVVLSVVSLILFGFGKLDAEQLKNFLTLIFGLFVTANAAQKLADKSAE